MFQTMTTDAHLKRPSVHQDRANAFIVLTMICVLAYTLQVGVLFPAGAQPFPKLSPRFLRPGAKAGRLVHCSASEFQSAAPQIETLRACLGRQDFLPPNTPRSCFAAFQSPSFSCKSSSPAANTATYPKISALISLRM